MESNGHEQLPIQVVERLFRDQVSVRVAIAMHPVTRQPSPCVPYKDLAEGFSYDSESLRQMIYRSKWLQEYSVTCMIQATDGKFYGTLCLFTEGVLTLLIKLQPDRCKDKEVGARIEEYQKKLILLLHDVLTGSITGKQDPLKQVFRMISCFEKIDGMKEGWAKEAAIDALECATGKRYPRPRQLGLAFTRKPEKSDEN